jgi:hypothetical protein
MTISPETGRTYKADNAVLPRRAVYISADGQVSHSDNVTTPLVGVTGKATRRYDATEHAAADEQAQVIEFNGAQAEIECLSAVTAGQMLYAGTSGKARPFDASVTSGVLSGATAHIFGPVIKGAAADGFCVVQMNQFQRQLGS